MFTNVEIVIIVIFFLYVITCCAGFGVLLLKNRVYQDLNRGLLSIIKRKEAEGNLDDIGELASETAKYYGNYMKRNPAVRKTYDSIVNWLDDVMMQTNMFVKRRFRIGIWFDEYYNTIKKLQQYFEDQQPYYQCNENQRQILADIRSLQDDRNEAFIDNMIERTKSEFIKQEADIKKNETTNLISIAIGIAGILVSVLLTILQIVG